MTDKQETIEQKHGPEFQSKTLMILLKDKDFLQQVSDAIDPEYFSSRSKKWICAKLIEHFREYRELPTSLVWENATDSIVEDALKVSVVIDMTNIFKYKNSTDLEYVKSEFINFCTNQAVKGALSKSIKLVHEHGDHNAAFDVFRKAINVISPKDMGHDYKADVIERLETPARECISTPWECINQIMNGGLGKGEIGCVAAPAGAGKSWVLVAIGAEAMRQAYNVTHITLELSDKATSRRYDTVFTGIPLEELDDNKERVLEAVDGIKGSNVVKHFVTNAATAETILAYVRQLDARGTTTDLLIVDYPDLLLPVRRTDRRHEELRTIYQEVRSIGGELQVPTWVASQVRRDAAEEEIIYQYHIAEAIGKIEVVDFAFTWARSTDMKSKGIANAHIIKNRNGPDATVFPARFIAGKGYIDIYDENATGGLGIQAQHHKQNLVANQLRKGAAHFEKMQEERQAEAESFTTGQE